MLKKKEKKKEVNQKHIKIYSQSDGYYKNGAILFP